MQPKKVRNALASLKPGVRRKTLLLTSGLLWTVIGLLLLVKGGFRLARVADGRLLIVTMAVLGGTCKSMFIIDRSARRGVERILHFSDGTCLGAVYSFQTWILVLCMMGLGVILRNSSLPDSLLSFVYVFIGWALLFSSRIPWRAWWAAGREHQEG